MFKKITQEQRDNFYNSIEKDENNFPIFIGNAGTLYTLIKSWKGPITYKDKEYILSITIKKWKLCKPETGKGIDKRLIDEKFELQMLKLQKQFYKATMDERVARKVVTTKYKKQVIKKYNSKANKEQREIKEKSLVVQNQLKVNEIYDLIVKGQTNSSIINYCVEKYNVTERKAVDLIRLTKNEIKKNIEEERDVLKDKHHVMLIELYNQNMERGDLKECREILATLNKMYGVNEPTKSTVEVNQKIIKFNFDLNTTPNNIQHNLKEAEDVKFEDINFTNENNLLNNNNTDGEDQEQTEQ